MCGAETDSDKLTELVTRVAKMNWSILEPQGFNLIVSPKTTQYMETPDLKVCFDSRSLQAMLSLLLAATEFREANGGSPLQHSIEKMQIYIRYIVAMLGWVVGKGDEAVAKFPIPPSGLYAQQLRLIDEVAQRNQIDEAMLQVMVTLPSSTSDVPRKDFKNAKIPV